MFPVIKLHVSKAFYGIEATNIFLACRTCLISDAYVKGGRTSAFL